MAESKVREQTVLEAVLELEELLRILNITVDYLVNRNPPPESPDESKKLRQANVFDEILDELSVCKGLTRRATEYIQMGISQKVQ